MTAYLIVYGEDPSDRLAAYAFADRAAALRASVGPLVPRVPADGHGGGCAFVIENERDITWSKIGLATLYRGFKNQGPKKFEDRASGIKRLFEMLPQYAVTYQEEELSMKTTSPTVEKKKKTRAPKQQQLGQFSPVRAGTILAKLVEAINGTRTLDEVSAFVNIDHKKLNPLLRHGLGKLHGIGHFIDNDEHVCLVLPKNKMIEDLIKQPAPERVKSTNGEAKPRKTKHQEAMEAAQRGELPEPPDFTATTHARARGKLEQVKALVAARDLAGLEAYTIKHAPSSYSLKLVNQYRIAAITALQAQ